MPNYLDCKCPKCHDRICFVVNQKTRFNGERTINA